MLAEIFGDTVVLDGVTFTLNFAEDIQIHEVDLNSGFIEQAKLFAKYGTAYEIALREQSQLETELKRIYAQQDYAARMNGIAAGKKLTEKMVENTVITSQAYQLKEEELHAAQKKTGLLKQARDAMIQRKEMLIQLGFSQRQERASDISMKQEIVKNKI